MSSEMSYKAHPRIAIAIFGAGPAGLALARVLQVHGIPSTIFERDASRHARSHGGTLDLHTTTGQKAMREAGLWSEFEKYARYDGDELSIRDKTNHVYVQKYPKPNDADSRPEIDRIKLRSILLDSVNPDSVLWDHVMESVEPRSDGTFDVRGRSKSKRVGGAETFGPFDLVVGADGAWSHVRPLLTDVRPSYAGVVMIEGNAANTDLRSPGIAKLVGRGSMFALSDRQGIFAQRLGDESVRLYWALVKPEDWVTTCGIEFENSEKTREVLLDSYFHDWSEDLKETLRKCDDGFIARNMYDLPVGLKWESRKGLTLIGDAAHLMTPFAGMGVNIALSDAMELGLALVEGIDDWPAAVRRYEEEMFERVLAPATQTKRHLESAFTPDAPKPLIENMMAGQRRTKEQTVA